MKVFRQALNQQSLVVTATLPLKTTSTAASITHDLECLSGMVDAVQVFDDRHACGHMSAIAAASLVLAHDLDAVVHFTCRDSNRVGLQADLLGATAIGVTSLMLSRGEKLKNSSTARGKGVFDIRSAALTLMAKTISEDRSLVAEPGLLIGAPVTVFAPPDDWEATRVVTRIDAGASLLQSQPCLDAALLRTYLRAVIDRKILRRSSFIVDVPLLTSQQQLRDLMQSSPGSAIPEDTAKRILQSNNPGEEGVAVFVEMIQAAKEIPGVAGINLYHDGDVADLVTAIQASGLPNSGGNS